MSERWPVIDTCFRIGVSLKSTCVAEEDLIPWMDENGVDIQMVHQVDEGYDHRTPAWNPYVGNDYVAKIQNMFPDRVFGLAMVNPWISPPKTWNYPISRSGEPMLPPMPDPGMEEFDRCFLDLKLRGLFINPTSQCVEFNNENVLYPYLTRLDELQRKLGVSLPVIVHGSGYSCNNTALQIGAVAADYPDLVFVMLHSGFVWCFGTTSTVGARHENMLLDLTGNVGAYSVYGAYQQCGAAKFTIGTNGPHGLPEVKKCIVDSFVGDKEEDRQLILGGNLAKRLGIPKIKAGN